MATGTWRDIEAAMHRRAARLEPELRKGIEECTRLVWQGSIDNMNKLIYANPPDTNKQFYRTSGGGKRKLTEKWRETAKTKGRRGGKGFKWTQTGNLLRSEKKRVKGLEGRIINDAKAKKGGTGYSHARHNLALGAGDALIIPPAPKKRRKSTRKAPFRALAIRETEAQRRAIMRGHVQKVLTV